MRCFLWRNWLIVWIFLFSLSCPGLAQCPTRKQLQIQLQHWLAQEDPSGQISALQNWQQQWQQCGYATDSTYIDGLLQLGLAYLYQNELLTATKVVQRALQLSHTQRPHVAADQPAKILYRLGMLLSEQNQPSITTLWKSVQSGQAIPSANRWVAHAYLYLAYAYISGGDFQQAIHCADNGIQVAKNTTDRPLMTKLLHEKAKVLNILGQYNPARQAAERSVTLAEKDGYQALIAKGYKLLGVIAENQQQLMDALRYRQRALDISRLSHDANAPNYSVSVGTIYYQLRRYDQAIPYFRFGVDNNKNLYARAYSLDWLAQAYQQKKIFLQALHYYQQGLTTIPIGFRNSSITSLPNAQAIRQADQKDYLLTLIQDKADTWLDYARATGNNRQRLQNALNTYKVADQMIDFMRWEHIGEESKLFWREKTRSMYERAIETCYQLQNTQQAFRFMEKSRAVMLADKLNELGARQKLTKSQVEQEERLQKAVSDQQTKLADSDPGDTTAYNTERTALLTKQDSLSDFLKRIEVSNPAYFRYKYDTTSTALSALRIHLKEQQASFVTYFIGDSALYVLGVTADTTMLIRQPLRRYQQHVQAFMELLATPDAMNYKPKRRQFLELGNGLYTQLLAPFKLPNGRVIISPDGSFVPFETLSRRADETDYLVNNYAFSYTYSARLLLKKNVASVSKASKHEFLGIAPVTFAPSLKQVVLPGSDSSLKLIASHFSSPLLLTHGNATRRAFLTSAVDASVIQLFTHAIADSSNQEPMLFFADSTLKLSDLSGENLPNAQLVVLAACKTGVGTVQRGEGVFSLARGFAALGVPSVLTTLWSVQDDATYTLTELFYRYIADGLPKDIALQRAKQDWLKTADQLNQLPNIWAGLIVVGDTQPLLRTNYVMWMAIVSLLILAAFGGWFWYKKKRRPVLSVSAPHSV